MKTISIFLALINLLMAGLILAFSLSPIELHRTAIWWSLTKSVLAVAVIVVSLITWLAGARRVRAGLLSLCSLFLTALGAATIVWTLHLALVTGDRELYMVMYGGSLIMQGLASLFGFALDSSTSTLL